MKKILLVAVSLLLVGCLVSCASGPVQLQAVVDELKFGEGEKGCMRAAAAIDLNANPFASATANITIVKNTGEDAPPC